MNDAQGPSAPVRNLRRHHEGPVTSGSMDLDDDLGQASAKTDTKAVDQFILDHRLNQPTNHVRRFAWDHEDIREFVAPANLSNRGTDEVFSNVTHTIAGLRFEELIHNAINRGHLRGVFQRSQWPATSAYDLNLRAAADEQYRRAELKWACCVRRSNDGVERSCLQVQHLVREASDVKLFGFYYPGTGTEPNRLDVFSIEDNRRLRYGFDAVSGPRGRQMEWKHFGDPADARRKFTDVALTLGWTYVTTFEFDPAT